MCGQHFATWERQLVWSCWCTFVFVLHLVRLLAEVTSLFYQQPNCNSIYSRDSHFRHGSKLSLQTQLSF